MTDELLRATDRGIGRGFTDAERLCYGGLLGEDP
jgi:hypothetical protein